ncbi:MAG: ATP-binding protein [Acidobacteriia bacterium]|nr:ATP-binding protein [Terriglobia bacterium]
MRPCDCTELHERRRIVLTGGPGAGKTAVLELIRQSFCEHVRMLPEAAGIVFGGGFARNGNPEWRRAAQRAIFYVERELETAADTENKAVVLCDRGTVDGAAYWPGPGDLWSSVGATLAEQMERYHAVIHLRTPTLESGYNRINPLRIESAADAAAIDDRIAQLWKEHPKRFVVEASKNFLDKATRVLEILKGEMPECCRHHMSPLLTRLERP